MNKTAPLRTNPEVLAAPIILKVDPPNWWVGHSLNPVRLLIRGKNLRSVRARSTDPKISLGPAQTNASGTYLFVDLRIDPNTAPGLKKIIFATERGETETDFELLEISRNRPQACSQEDLVYLIMPDRFAKAGPPANRSSDDTVDRNKPRHYHGGNLRGIESKLPYLKSLGVTALWVTPVFANADKPYPSIFWSPEPFTDYHGYGPVDFYAVDHRLGDINALRELIAKAHAEGMKVILDHVSNHTGSQHPWMQDAPTESWYFGTPKKHLHNTFQSWVLTDPYGTEDMRRPVVEGWFCDICPDLNQNNPEVSRYLTQNMLWWLEMSGADSLRHDSVGLVPRKFWKDSSAALKKQYPEIKIVGEINGETPSMISCYLGGRPAYDGLDTGLDIGYDFPLRKAIRGVFLDGKPIEEIPATLSQDRAYLDPTALITCFGLHDDGRFMGHPKASPEALKLAFALILTTRGIPLIYYGDEIALEGREDPDNRRDFPGGWQEDSHNAFSNAGRTQKEEDVFRFVQTLTQLRRNSNALRRGRLINLWAGSKVYAYARDFENESVIVVLNNGDAPEEIACRVECLRLAPTTKLIKDCLSDSEALVLDHFLKAKIPPKSAAIYRIEK